MLTLLSRNRIRIGNGSSFSTFAIRNNFATKNNRKDIFGRVERQRRVRRQMAKNREQSKFRYYGVKDQADEIEKRYGGVERELRRLENRRVRSIFKASKGFTPKFMKKDEDIMQFVKRANQISEKHEKRGKLLKPYFDVITSVKHEEIETVQEAPKEKIPNLSHGLERVLFSPGVHFLQDPRTKVFNFSPYLKKIVDRKDFDFDSLPPFQPVSKHSKSLELAIESKSKYYSSTSAMTGILSKFYFLLNNYDGSSAKFGNGNNLTAMDGYSSTSPISLIVSPEGSAVIEDPKTSKPKEHFIYSISSDNSFDVEILLSVMGNCLEALLTNDPERFEKFKKSYVRVLNGRDEEEEELELENVYNYAKYGSFLMRSQIDCYDERLPKGTFDIKTRAVCAIRFDYNNPEVENNKYQIWKLNGEFESFEREFKDLIKSGALLKYLFQARIGQMDGIFVSYHNLNSFFGFQYFSLEELDAIFYSDKIDKSGKIGSVDEEALVKFVQNEGKDCDLLKLNDNLPSYIGETQFKISMKIWEALLDRIHDDTKHYEKNRPFRLVVNAVKEEDTSSNDSSVFLEAHVVMITPYEKLKLEEFPSRFKTSIREDITREQRYKNMLDHVDKLNEFNKIILSNLHVRKYYIKIVHPVINNEPAAYLNNGEYYDKYTSIDDEFGVKFMIRKVTKKELRRKKISSSINRLLRKLARNVTIKDISAFEVFDTAPEGKVKLKRQDTRKLTEVEVMRAYSKIGVVEHPYEEMREQIERHIELERKKELEEHDTPKLTEVGVMRAYSKIGEFRSKAFSNASPKDKVIQSMSYSNKDEKHNEIDPKQHEKVIQFKKVEEESALKRAAEHYVFLRKHKYKKAKIHVNDKRKKLIRERSNAKKPQPIKYDWTITN